MERFELSIKGIELSNGRKKLKFFQREKEELLQAPFEKRAKKPGNSKRDKIPKSKWKVRDSSFSFFGEEG
jgi:elongation factor P--beta-lysine ligase